MSAGYLSGNHEVCSHIPANLHCCRATYGQCLGNPDMLVGRQPLITSEDIELVFRMKAIGNQGRDSLTDPVEIPVRGLIFECIDQDSNPLAQSRSGSGYGKGKL